MLCERSLMKILALTIAIVGMAVSSAAQNIPQKSAASGPTKVSGPPTKTASGLQYWDIIRRHRPRRPKRTTRQGALHRMADQRQKV
jgi:hypothetical protein